MFSYNNNNFLQYERTGDYSYTLTNLYTQEMMVTFTAIDGTVQTFTLVIDGTASLVLPGDGVYTVSAFVGVGTALVELHNGMLVEAVNIISCYRSFLEGLYCIEEDEEQVVGDCTPCETRNLSAGAIVFGGTLSERRHILAQINGILFLFYLAVFETNIGNPEYTTPLADRLVHIERVKTLFTKLNAYFTTKKNISSYC